MQLCWSQTFSSTESERWATWRHGRFGHVHAHGTTPIMIHDSVHSTQIDRQRRSPLIRSNNGLKPDLPQTAIPLLMPPALLLLMHVSLSSKGVCRTKVSYTGSKNSNNHFQTTPPFQLFPDIHKRQFSSCNMIFWPKILFTFLPAVSPEENNILERIFPCRKFHGDIPNKVIQSNKSQNCHKSGLNIVEWN